MKKTTQKVIIRRKKKKNKISLEKSACLAFSILVLCFAVVSLTSAAWNTPTTAPPGNNAPAPLNVGNVSQSRAGTLTVDTTGTTGNPTALNLLSNSSISPYNPALSVTGTISSTGGAILNTGAGTNGLLVQYGNVGIGTTNPAGKLDVEGGSSTTGVGTPIKLYAQNGSGSSNGGSIILMPGTSTDAGKYGLVQVGSATGATYPPYTNLNGLRISGGDTYNGIWQGQGALGINTNGTNLSLGVKNGVLGETITILGSNGYVGIGTATPGYNLEIAGTTKTTGGLIIQTTNGTTPSNLQPGQIWLDTSINP